MESQRKISVAETKAKLSSDVIGRMGEVPASCVTFRILYGGYQMIFKTPQSEEDMVGVLKIMNDLWEIHKGDCPEGKSLAEHLA